jgi:hypothetical protein
MQPRSDVSIKQTKSRSDDKMNCKREYDDWRKELHNKRKSRLEKISESFSGAASLRNVNGEKNATAFTRYQTTARGKGKDWNIVLF